MWGSLDSNQEFQIPKICVFTLNLNYDIVSNRVVTRKLPFHYSPKLLVFPSCHPLFLVIYISRWAEKEHTLLDCVHCQRRCDTAMSHCLLLDGPVDKCSRGENRTHNTLFNRQIL